MQSRLVVLAALAAVLLAAALPAPAAAAVGFGARIGSMSYSGEVFPGAGDPDAGLRYGVHMLVTPVPLVDVEVRGEYAKTEFNYSFDTGTGTILESEMEFRDLALYLSARYKFFSGPGVPLSLYVSGGVGWHLFNTEFLSLLGSGSTSGLTLDELDNTSRLGWHGVLGGEFKTIGFPFALFVEGRLETVSLDNDSLNSSGVYGGFTIGF
jgi:hypothetical protein